MRVLQQQRMLWVGVVMLGLCWGCGSGKPTDGTRPPADKRGTGQKDQSNTKPKPRIIEPPPKLTLPKVVLTEADQAKCLVKVGDALPGADLPDLELNVLPLQRMYGKRLTLVCFWTAGGSPESEQQATEVLQFLWKEVAEPYMQKDVIVIAVNVGNPPQVVERVASAAGAKFHQRLDLEGAFFAKVATERLPRIYLLDAEGKIVWFDFEYSRSSRRDLLQAIQVLLGEA